MGDDRITETHVSRVVFVGDRVYKAKKPVELGFIDLSSTSARLQACRDEVRLNSRLAPDVYDGVGVFRFPDGREEPVVVMKRLPADGSLSELVRQDDPRLVEHITAIAEAVARFHEKADRGDEIDRSASPDAVRRLWEENLTELSAASGEQLARSVLQEAQARAARFLQGRSELLQERVLAGRIVDGHGDLLADDIFFPDNRPRIIDCLEYRADLRWGDTLLDVAFLAMDLARLGRPDVGALFLDRYREHSGDSWPDSLAHFYVAYRASIRAKVACIRARTDEAVNLMAICVDHLRGASVRLVLVGGLPGTGKSTLAAGLREATGWELVGTDATRKRLAGKDPTADATSAWKDGLYAPDVTEAVYAELLRQAETSLRRGQSVILDGTWSRQSWRAAAADLAGATSSDLFQLRCDLPMELSAGRIRNRLASGARESDATPDVALAMAAVADPWLEAETVDTSVGPEEAVSSALGVVPRAPAL